MSTKKLATPQDPEASCRKDASVGPYEDFCDTSFDFPPGKSIEEVLKVFQLLKNILKLIDETPVVTH